MRQLAGEGSSFGQIGRAVRVKYNRARVRVDSRNFTREEINAYSALEISPCFRFLPSLFFLDPLFVPDGRLSYNRQKLPPSMNKLCGFMEIRLFVNGLH